MAKPVHDAAIPLYDLASAYSDTAADMVRERDALVSLYSELLDTAAELAAAGAVAGGTTTSGVGAPVGVLAGLYAAYKGYKLIRGIEKLFSYIDRFHTALQVWEAAHTNFAANHGILGLPELDTSSLKIPSKASQ